MDADNFEKDEKLAHIRQSRGYKNHDFVLSSKIPDLESKLETFKTEHIHYDEEIRLLLDGSGYFDLKDAQDNWIRVETPKVRELEFRRKQHLIKRFCSSRINSLCCPPDHTIASCQMTSFSFMQ